MNILILFNFLKNLTQTQGGQFIYLFFNPCTILIVTNCFVFIFSLGIALQRLNSKSVETKNNLHQTNGRERCGEETEQLDDQLVISSKLLIEVVYSVGQHFTL